MQELPIGMQSFEKIRRNNYLYVDKTEKLLQLAKTEKSYFLSRPRRFGKSLTLSTLEAMFKGKAELFKGLYAEEWVKEQSNHPSPVIKLDMSSLGFYENKKELNDSIINYLENYIFLNDLSITSETDASKMLFNIIIRLYKMFGPVVVLIDEYDKPMTDNLNDLKKAEEMRETLSKFYIVVKNCGDYLRFVMLTGVSKFSKVGLLSGVNNLKDISMDEKYGDIVGYTQQELEDNFGEWIENTSQKLSMNKKEVLNKIKEYYDGFSFDGVTRVYNPFSVLNFFDESKFRNYWHVSGSPSFLRNYLQNHRIKNPDKYDGMNVAETFADKREIESASVESFLFQAGYLTIKKWEKNEIVLGYPNEEVRRSLADMYLDDIYRIEGYITLGYSIWKALEDDDIENLVKSFNLAISGIPYEDFQKDKLAPSKDKLLNEIKEDKKLEGEKKCEYFYRSLFVMLLRGAGVIYFAEVHTFKGRSDVVIVFKNKVVVIEFKLAKNSSEVEKKRKEGEEQIKSRDYSSDYEGSNKKVINLVLVVDDEKRQIVL